LAAGLLHPAAWLEEMTDEDAAVDGAFPKIPSIISWYYWSLSSFASIRHPMMIAMTVAGP